MLSNQWEVVTKSKKQRNLEKKVEAHTEKKRLELAGPRLEEILPQHQLKSIFSKATKEKVNKSPKKTAPNASNKSSPTLKSKSNSNNETHKKQPAQSAPPAPPKPKNLETALAKMPMDELNGLMEQRSAYLGNELYWLRQVAAYLNSALPFDSDPVFSGKATNYPTNVVPKNMKTALIENFKAVGESNLSYFFDTLLTRLTEELYNNKPVVGYKLLLQIVGQNWPVVCSNSLAKTAILRNSYQNRSNIGLSILWGVGQGGYRDINIGVKVWQNIMLPVIEMKSYSRFVCEYIEKVLSSSDNEKQKLVLSQSDFFTTFNALKAKYSIPRECQQILANSSQLFLKKYIESSPKLSNIFLTLFRDIKSAQNQLEINGCIDCLIHGDDCFKVWKMNYKKNVLPSNMLLRQIYQQWDGSAVKLRDSKAFDEFLVLAAQLNLELSSSKKKDPSLDELLSLFENVQDKSTQQKKKTAAGKSCSSCGCKWFLGSLVLLAVIVGVLHYDTNTNGKGVFANSATGKVLKNAGLLPYVEKGYVVVMTNTARGYKWAEQRVPGYVKPAGQLACDLYKTVRNAACGTCGLVKDYAVAKWPVVSAALEQYIPGLPKKLEDITVSTRVLVSDSYGKITEFFKTNVFVGSLSPENLGKALNQTQVAVIKYVNKFSQEMDAWAKRK